MAKHAGEEYFPGVNETQLSLLGGSHGVEIMVHTIKANDLVMLTPSEDKDLCEYAYIIEGELTLEAEGECLHLTKNDFFSFCGLEKTILMKCGVPVTLLYITSKPTFHHVKMYVNNLDELVNKINEKDQYTKKHCQHVMDYSIAISRRMGCSASIIERLAISALFHDVGKCRIPDEILQKPGKLTAEERKFIYKHPIHSSELVEANFGEEVANIVLCHHERQDGSGYPQSLSGDQIPLEARIIAVADSFDAMTTKRPYNTPKSFEEAVEEMAAMPGVYDKNAVEALRALVESGEIYHVCDLLPF
ncbi:MAG: HD domain-containing phosphohydrolase [Clostridia bacterium]